jgi:hypothetical protein
MYGYLLNTTGVHITNGQYFDRYIDPNFPNTVLTNITVSNIMWNNATFYLAATIYDCKNVPVAYSLLPHVILSDLNATNTAQTPLSLNSEIFGTGTQLSIPSYAYVGAGTLFVNIYNADPYSQGLPYCPERSTGLNIIAYPLPPI